jgi:hypothetical protein
VNHFDAPFYQSPRANATGKIASVSIFFEDMGNIFRRVEISHEVPLTSAMVDKRVNIMVDVLWTLAMATKRIKQSKASELLPGDMGRLTPLH